MLRFAANLTMLFNELDFLDRFAAAKRAGFEGVEYLFPYPYDKNVLAEKLAANGLKQVLAIEYAKALGCTQLNCLAGIPSATTGIGWAEETLVENLKFAARALRVEGIRLLLEPINTRDIPGFLVCHTQRTFDYFDQVGEDNLYLLYDAYHMQVMEGDLTSTIERNLKRIAHIQIADNPGRHEPGTGEINYPFVFGRLQAMDYGGWIGCEYKPTASTLAGLGWVTPYLTRSPAR